MTWLHGHHAQPVAPLLPVASPAPRSSTPFTSVSVPTRMSAVTARVLRVGTAVIDHGLLGRTWGELLHRCSTVSSLLRRLVQGQDVIFLGPVPDSARPA